MKLLISAIFVFGVFSLVIIGSDTPLYIKMILLLVTLFFLLPLKIFTKKRIWRKSVAAFWGAMLFMALLFLIAFIYGSLSLSIADIGEDLLATAVILFIAALGFFIYGMPVSIVADMVAQRFSHRFLVSGLVHIAGGLLLMPILWLLPVVCALIFWLVDEVLQEREREKEAEA